MGEKITIEVDGKEISGSKEDLAKIFKKEEKKIEMPKDTGESLPPPKDRNIHYKFDTENNPQWKGQEDVWLKEPVAISFHSEFIKRGGVYMGDQNGNMTPPRDTRAAYYNASGMVQTKKRQHGKS